MFGTQITLADLTEAKNQEITLASQSKAGVGSKKLAYNVGQREYRIYVGGVHSQSTGSPDFAVEFYNETALG